MCNTYEILEVWALKRPHISRDKFDAQTYDIEPSLPTPSSSQIPLNNEHINTIVESGFAQSLQDGSYESSDNEEKRHEGFGVCLLNLMEYCVLVFIYVMFCELFQR